MGRSIPGSIKVQAMADKIMPISPLLKVKGMMECLQIIPIMLVCCTIVSYAQTNSSKKAVVSPVKQNIIETQTQKPVDGHLYEFTYTLNFAKELGFSKIIDLLEQEQYQSALQALEKKTGSGFAWNDEATNGYQFGFFAEALKGICLEKTGEVVKAYRSYQNARYYCDEEKVSFLDKPLPAPKLEVYVGIGRMCNEAGRWTDSLNYLDAARMEAAEYPTIAIASNRSLIKRAYETGDYNEAIELYKDLYSFNILTRKEYKQLPEIHFWMRNNVEGFRILLEGLTHLGIDNDMGFKDPIIDCFMNNVMRAQEEDIKYFYDLLGYEIIDTRALKGDEKYLAKLINARKAFCNVYNYLKPEDDLDLLEKRIKHVKNILKSKSQKQKYEYKRNNRNKIILRSTSHKTNGKPDKVPIEHYEDMLMLADWNLNCWKNYSDELTNYVTVFTACTNIGIAEYTYDGTTLINASNIGREILNIFKRTRTKDKNLETDLQEMPFDGSMHIAEKIILLTKNVNKSEEEYRAIIERVKGIVPKSHHGIMSLLTKALIKSYRKCEYEKVLILTKEILECRYDANSIEVGNILALMAMCEYNKAFDVLIENCMITSDPGVRNVLIDLGLKTWSWGSDEALLRFYDCAQKCTLYHLIKGSKHYIGSLREFKEYNIKRELQARRYINEKDYTRALDIWNGNFNQPQHYINRANILIQLGETNRAVASMTEGLYKRTKIVIPLYPNQESKFIEKYIHEADTKTFLNYSNIICNINIHLKPYQSNTTKDVIKKIVNLRIKENEKK